jgi:hypothetical protein
MILHLSGASHPESEQRDVMASTGGFISSTAVPNGGVNMLFDDVSCYGMTKHIIDTVGVFLKNDSDQIYNNVVLQQVYDSHLGDDTKCVKFEWAAVEPKDNEYMEKVGNRKLLPYNADFFDPVAKREQATLKILTPGQAGDVVNVLGVDALLDGNTIEDVVIALTNAFEENLDYTLEPKGDDSVYIERKAFIFTNDPIELVTPGSATAEPVNFSGGFDEGVLLIEEMLPGDTVGLWIKRTILKTKKTSCEKIEENYDNLFGKEFSEESIYPNHEDNEECHQAIFSWD